MTIYNVMCTKHCEYTLRNEAIQCIDNESFVWLGCMCTSGLYKFYNLTKWLLKDILSAFLDVQNWCYIVSALYQEKDPKESTAKQLEWTKWVWNCIKIGKCHLLRWIHTPNLFSSQTQNVWHLKQENVYPHNIDWCVKNQLGVVDRGPSHDF